ncbi:MAG: CvpA family protein [Candidatus Delongbacteria bacterium]|nr:CvpA family protein [Candidatus Delongbacteria bacterium]
MIFDILLILMLIVTLNRAGKKGCTEDMHFVIGFFLIVRMAGAFYMPVSKILINFIKNLSFAAYASYILVAVVVFFIFTSIAGQRIIEAGKKLPKTTGLVVTYVFAVIKTVIIYSVIFSFIYTLPVLHRLPENLITPRSYKLTYGILGVGTEDLFQDISDYLTETLKNPIKFMESQKAKQAASSSKQLNAVKAHEGLEDFVPSEKPVEKKTEEE